MSTKKTVAEIVQTVKTKVTEMGGGEQFIGSLSALSKECGVKSPTNFLVDLGEALDMVGLQLSSGPGAPDDLYASPAT